jgi:hypothetical protein
MNPIVEPMYNNSKSAELAGHFNEIKIFEPVFPGTELHKPDHQYEDRYQCLAEQQEKHIARQK